MKLESQELIEEFYEKNKDKYGHLSFAQVKECAYTPYLYTRKEIENFNRQELVNPYENISVSTLKSDQQTDANLSNVATSVDALQRGGTRAVLGGIPRINESNILLQGLISQDLEKQDIDRDLLIAKGEQEITGIRENREINALQGLGQQLQTARQDTMSGISNAITSGLSISNALKFDKANELNTTGTNPLLKFKSDDASLNNNYNSRSV